MQEPGDLFAFEQVRGRTTIPLDFDPYGSFFVVFRAPMGAGAHGRATRNFRAVVGPEADAAIRYYSGTARYQTTFDFPRDRATTGDRSLLDLGEVRELAEVRLNDKALGVPWTRPFRVDITDAIKPVKNRLEVDPLNTWRNRLVGDRGLSRKDASP